MHVDAPRALDGMRLELFSMLAVAASQGLGVALMPPMLIEQELRAAISSSPAPAAARQPRLLSGHACAGGRGTTVAGAAGVQPVAAGPRTGNSWWKNRVSELAALCLFQGEA
jgi:hypothetical protein